MSKVNPLNQLSYSSLNQLHSCARKYQLDKSGFYLTSIPRDTSNHLGYGLALGAGLQALLSNKSLNEAILETIINYNYEEIYPEIYAPQKSLFHAIDAIAQFHASELEELLEDWEPLMINGKPASEVEFAIELPNDYVFRGYIDFILYSPSTNKILVVEIKTTGAYKSLKMAPDIAYRNSTQGLVYTMVADYIASKLGIKAELSVAYLVNRTVTHSFESYIYPKSRQMRLDYLENLITETKYIDLLKSNGESKLWPMNGNACNGFNKECAYFNICGINQNLTFTPSLPTKGDDAFILTFEELLELQLA